MVNFTARPLSSTSSSSSSSNCSPSLLVLLSCDTSSSISSWIIEPFSISIEEEDHSTLLLCRKRVGKSSCVKSRGSGSLFDVAVSLTLVSLLESDVVVATDVVDVLFFLFLDRFFFLRFFLGAMVGSIRLVIADTP